MKSLLKKILLSGVFVAFSLQAAALTLNDTAPNFELPGNNGVVSLVGLKNKVIYIDFWASWCGPCKQSFPWLNEMQAKYGSRGFQVVGINVDAKTSDAKVFLTEVPAKFTIAYDDKGATPKQFGIKGMPSSVIVDGAGKVIAQHTGFREADKAQLEQSIRQALTLK